MSPAVTGSAVQSRPPTASGAAGSWRRVAKGSFTWAVRGDLSEETTAAILSGVDKPEDFLKRPDSRSPSMVFRFSAFVAKRYRARGIRERLKALLRGSRAQRALEWTKQLAVLDIATIQPVAIGHARGRPWESCLVSDHIANRCSVHEYLERLDSNAARRPILVGIAGIMARLHNAGISHGDAHLANFVIERGSPPRLMLIDLDALRFRRISVAIAANDLKRLLDYAPGSEREHLRFLLTYSRRRAGAVDPRQLLRELNARRRGPGPLRNVA